MRLIEGGHAQRQLGCGNLTQRSPLNEVAPFAIVWLLLVAGFSAATDLVVFIRLQIAHKHVELDRSLLGRFIVAFFRRHITPLLTVTMLKTALRPVEQKRRPTPFPPSARGF